MPTCFESSVDKFKSDCPGNLLFERASTINSIFRKSTVQDSHLDPVNDKPLARLTAISSRFDS